MATKQRVFPVPIKIALGILVLVVVASVGVLYHEAGQDSPNLGNGAIEQLIPKPGDKILQQASIGIDLSDGYDASLAVNGIPIPDDQMQKTPELNFMVFQPGPGKVFEAFPAGQSCVVATYWLQSTGPSNPATKTWCFTVV